MAITPTKIILRHSYNSGAIPDVNSLVNGEIAFNATDSTFFWKGADGNLVSQSFDITENIDTILQENYSSFFVADANLINGENNKQDLVLVYQDGEEKNLGDVRGATGVGISPVDTYEWGDEVPTAVSSPALSIAFQRTGVTVAVLKGAVTGDPPWDSAHIYVYNAIDDDWTDLGEIQGAQGVPGETGPAGVQGLTGATGPVGPQGPAGPATGGASEIDIGSVRFAPQDDVWLAEGLATNDNGVVRAKHLLVKKDSVNGALTFGDLNAPSSPGDGRIRIHSDGQVGFTLNNSAVAPSAGDETPGGAASNILPEGFAAFRRDTADVFLDLNVGGSISTIDIIPPQTLSLVGSSLTISNGNSITLPYIDNANFSLIFDSTPELGGDLNVRTYSIKSTGSDDLIFSTIEGTGDIIKNTPKEIHRNGEFTIPGDIQSSSYILRRQVTHNDDTWYSLSLDGSDPLVNFDQGIVIPNFTTCTGRATVVGTTTSTGLSFGFEILFVVSNDDAFGNLELKSSSVTTIHTDDTFDANIGIDNTNKQILIQVQNTNATPPPHDIRWGATINLTSITFS